MQNFAAHTDGIYMNQEPGSGQKVPSKQQGPGLKRTALKNNLRNKRHGRDDLRTKATPGKDNEEDGIGGRPDK